MFDRFHVYDRHGAVQPIAKLPWRWLARAWAERNYRSDSWVQVVDTRAKRLDIGIEAKGYRQQPITEGNFRDELAALRPQMRQIHECLAAGIRLPLFTGEGEVVSHSAHRRLWQLLAFRGVMDDEHQCDVPLYPTGSERDVGMTLSGAIHAHWSAHLLLKRQPSLNEALGCARYLHTCEVEGGDDPWLHAYASGVVEWIMKGLEQDR